MREFEKYAEAKEKGQSYSSFGFELARTLVFPEIKETLSKRSAAGSGPSCPAALRSSIRSPSSFDLLGFDILEGYGLTETIGTDQRQPARTEQAGYGRETAPGRRAEDRRGRRGPGTGPAGHARVSRDAEATSEAIDAEGWFHTGDIGELDIDGYLRITDRKKDLIKTSGGKYIAPQAIEGALKTMSDLNSQVVVIGDRAKYVSVLVTVVEDQAKRVAAEAGEPASSYRDAASSKAVRAKVQDAIDRLERDASVVRDGEALHHPGRDFSIESGELTPSLKVRRKAATQEFQGADRRDVRRRVPH